MKTNKILIVHALRMAAALLLTGVGVSQAQQQLYTPVTSGFTWRDNANEANGVFFIVGSTNMPVSHLGYFNGTNNVPAPGGLKVNHPVGIYRCTYITTGGTYVTNLSLIAQVTVPAGITNGSGVVTNSYYYNNFFWMQLDPPLVLSANTTYLLAGQAYNNDGDWWQDATGSSAGAATWNAGYAPSTRAAAYGPTSTSWPYGGTTIFTRNGLNKAYVMPMLGNLPQGPATVALNSTNPVTLTGRQTLTIIGFACGQAPITCQWWQNGVAISGQTSPTLSIPNAWDTNNGTYYLTVSNTVNGTAYGEQSPSVSVTVYTAPTNLVVTPATYGQTETLYAGANANFAVTSVSGVSPFTYAWYTNGILDATVTNATYSISNVQASSPTTYTCLVTNSAGAASNTWNIAVVPQPATPYAATVLADNPIGYWRLNEADNSLNNGNYNVVADDYWGGNSGVYSNTVLSQAGYGQGLANFYGYSPAADTESSALFRNFPTTTTSNSYAGNINNVSFSMATNKSAAFSVEAWVNGGTGQIAGAGLVTKGAGNGGEQFDLDVYNNAFRFFIRDAGGAVHGPTSTFLVDGNWHHVVAVVDETNSLISLYVDSQQRWTAACSPSNGVLSSTAPMSIGARRSSSSSQYDLQYAGNINDVAIYSFALSSNQVYNHWVAAGIPPKFTVKPVAATNVNQGTELIVPAAALGASPLNYQWYDVTGGYPGVPVANQTNATLDIPNIQHADFDGHTLALVASNPYGAVTNQVALGVYSVPFFTQNLLPTLQLYAGGSATWTVATAGPQPIYYVWLSNGVPILSATNATLTLSNLQAGSYSCWASNSLGSSTSVVVHVTIVPPPTAPYPVAVLNDHPLGYWRLNESDNSSGNNGAVANDYWGGNSGAYSNTILGQVGYSSALASQFGYSPATDPTETSAQFGFYPGFSAFSNYVGSIPNINFATPTNTSGNFTIEAWVNGDNQQDGINLNAAGIVAKGAWAAEQFTLDTGGASSGSYYYRFTMRDAGGVFHSAGTNSAAFGPDGRWHYLAGVLDQSHSNLCLYMDGVKVATSACSPSNGVLNSSVPVSIGSRLNSAGVYAQQFFGNVNDLAIYNYALSSNQVAAHYLSAGIPPSFILQPPSSTNVNEGTMLIVQTRVFGSPTLSYQWYDYYSGSPVPIAGQTSNTLVIPNISQAQYNGHTLGLTVTNIYGQASSVTVYLQVNAGPPNSVSITPSSPPPMYVGLPITFTATAQGTLPFSYTWTLDGTNIPGASSSTYTYTNLSASHTISCNVSNSVDGASGNNVFVSGVDAPPDTYGVQILNDRPMAFLRLDEALGSGIAYDYVGGHNAAYTYSGVVGGVPGFSPAAPAETATVFGTNGQTFYSMALEYDQSGSGIQNVDFSTQGANAHFSIEAWVNAPAGQRNSAGIVTKGNGNGGEQFCLDVNGGRFRFFVRAANGAISTAQSPNIGPDGIWHHLVGVCDEASGAVQLYIDGATNASGTMVSGAGLLGPLPAFGPILTSIGSRTTTNTDGYYSNQLHNAAVAQVALYSNVLSPGQVLAHYQAAAEPPQFYIQPSPVSFTHYQGLALSYTAAANGSPLAYQWYKNGVAILGQTGTNLSFTSIMPADSGAYYLVATNIYGAGTSSVATLTVVAPETPYETQLLAENPANYWRFNETNGTTAYDYIGGVNGTYGPLSTNGFPGPSAPAFPFETNNTAVAMDHSSPSNPNTSVYVPTLGYSNNTFTITAWVYPFNNITNYEGVFFTRSNSPAKGLGLGYVAGPGNLNEVGYTWDTNSSSTWNFHGHLTTPTGQWSFVALTIASNQAVIYVGTNGVLKAVTNAIPHDAEAWNGPVFIGTDTTGGDRTFDGAVDEVAVFNRTLSGSDINNLFLGYTPVGVALSPQNYAYAGFPYSLTVEAIGFTPSGYQWVKNGTDLVDGGTLSGSQNGTLSFNPIAWTDAGIYQVVVTNQSSTLTSGLANLTVLPWLGFNGTGAGVWSVNGVAAYTGTNTLQLTDGNRSEASSSFFNYPVYIGGFQASFTYQDVTGNGADGTAFVVQNDPRGPAAVGLSGGGLGYAGITNSAAAELHIYGSTGVAFQTNGGTGPYTSSLPVDLDSGDPINVSLLYLNGTLSMTLTDTVTAATFTTNTALNIPAVVGTNTAYVGFTAGDGSVASTQVVSNFKFTSLVNVSAQAASGRQLTISWPGASGGYVLEQNTNLARGTWALVPNVGMTNQVILPATNGAMYYRLIQSNAP